MKISTERWVFLNILTFGGVDSTFSLTFGARAEPVAFIVPFRYIEF